MRKAGRPVFSPQRKLKRFLKIIILFCAFHHAPVSAIELDPYPVFDFSRDAFSITAFREERPNYYWVNTGVPDIFFNGVQQTSAYPGPTVYSMRSMEYGVQTKGWVSDQLQGTGHFPF